MSVAAASAPRLDAGRVSWRDILALLKLRIDVLVVCVALAAALAGGSRSPLSLSVLVVACLGASAGASCLNHYFDRHLDARMTRTRRRPLPSGRVTNPRLALWLGVALLALSQASAVTLGPAPALYLLAGGLTYAVVYTWWLKPRTAWNIVIGGAAGSFAALAGWETAGSAAAPAPILLAVILLLWTPSHFWSLAIVLERDYREAGVPMLSAVVGAQRTADAVLLNTLLLVAASVALAPFVGWVYLLFAVPAAIGYLACVFRLRRRPDTPHAWRAFKLSGLYLLAILAGLVLTAVV